MKSPWVMCSRLRTDVPTASVVDQISSNYFTVNVNNMISPEVLEYYLKAEFANKAIDYNFEYGIYNCANQQMVFGKDVSMPATVGAEAPPVGSIFPELSASDYYFGVYFPLKEAQLISNMGIWTFSSMVLLVVLAFFAYSIFIILKQKRLSEVQRDFINNMTHEFKTPISTIAVSAEVLQQANIETQPERLKNYASIIQTENNRLKKQVERVLQMAVLNKDKLDLKREEVEIHEVLEEVIQSMDISLQEKQRTITFRQEAEQGLIIADRLHMTNIFYNLIDNAIKYCQSTPQIEILTKNTRAGLEVNIRDNGIGIDKEEQKKVFHRFYRVPTGNVHDVKGFGLGLNYVKTIVEAHHGSISLESIPGEGSSFTILLPFK